MRLSERKFKDWLAEHRDQIVGTPLDSCNCPLARFCKDHGVIALVQYTTASIVSASGQAYLKRLPPWARDFVEALDYSPHRCGEVTGAECLRLLGTA